MSIPTDDFKPAPEARYRVTDIGEMILDMCNGVATFIVFGEPDATQTKAIAKFRDAGFRATWVTNFADGKHFLTNR
tara:strand:- start:2750 stop:2977 length:228 start_codon:yes stop_codon:yes gene_type:complete